MGGRQRPATRGPWPRTSTSPAAATAWEHIGSGLELIDRWRPALQLSLGAGNSQVLLAGRTHAILLRKLGRLDEAAEIMRENQERTEARSVTPTSSRSPRRSATPTRCRELGELDEASGSSTRRLRAVQCTSATGTR